MCILICIFSLIKLPLDSPAVPCDTYEPPTNGELSCDYSGVFGGYSCSVKCNSGFQFERTPAVFYICQTDGNWFVWAADSGVDLSLPWPDCICK